MKAFKQIMLNGSLLCEDPFRREFELQGYLIAHPELLSLAEGDEQFEIDDLIGVERKMKKGRVDLVVSYRSGLLAIAELKKDKVTKSGLEQLKRYLTDPNELKKCKSIQEYLDENGNDGEVLLDKRNLIGVLVGREFDQEVLESMKKGKGELPRVYALSIKRYRAEKNEFLMTNVETPLRMRDYQKYFVNGKGPFGKGRMVLAAIREFLAMKQFKTLSYEELISETYFPPSLRGGSSKWGCISLLQEALAEHNTTGRKRHFLDEDELICLADGKKIAVSTQWGIGNIGDFIRRANKLGISVEKAKKGKVK